MAAVDWFGWVIRGANFPRTGDEDQAAFPQFLDRRTLFPSQLEQIQIDDVNNDGRVGDLDRDGTRPENDQLGGVRLNGQLFLIDELANDNFNTTNPGLTGTVVYEGISIRTPFYRIVLTNGDLVFTFGRDQVEQFANATDGTFNPNLITFAQTGVGTETTSTVPTRDLVSSALVTFTTPVLVCFSGATMIATVRGERAARDLRVGDRLPTKDNGVQTIRYAASRRLTRSQLRGNPDLAPIRIAAGALGEDLPLRDLTVSPQHAILLHSATAELLTGEREVLIRAKHLLALPGVARVLPEEGVDYVHFLFDRHEIVFAEGAQAESLFLGDRTLDTFDPASEAELMALFGTLNLARQHKATARLIPDGRTQMAIAARLGGLTPAHEALRLSPATPSHGVRAHELH